MGHRSADRAAASGGRWIRLRSKRSIASRVGERLRTGPLAGELRRHRLGAAAVDTGWLIAAVDNGDLVALRGTDGREIWRRQLGGNIRIHPSIAGQRLFVPMADGRILGLDLTSGEQLWARALGGSPTRILALDDLFVGSTDNFFYSLSPKHGAVNWRWRTGADIIGRPVADEDRVYFLSLDHVLRALDRRSGVQRWTQAVPIRPMTGPRPAWDTLIISGRLA